jgi:Protein of unknown function (DUF1579)
MQLEEVSMSQPVPKAEARVDQQPMMKAEPQREHQWLHKLVGEWTYETEAPIQPGQPAVKATGTESVRSLGGVWVLAEGQGEMPGGGPATTLMTLGYDPDRKKFVGTWIGSMMTYLWPYSGKLDAAERVLTLDSEGPSMADPGKTTQYRDVIEFKSDDYRTLTAHVLADDGTWQQLMMVEYRRK